MALRIRQGGERAMIPVPPLRGLLTWPAGEAPYAAQEDARLTTIYGLVDPRTSALRYIGKTVVPKDRVRQHIKESRRGVTRRERWVASLTKIGLRPEIVVIEEVGKEWADAEKFWIAYYRTIGADLVNATPGGEGVVGPKSPEHKEKLAAALRGRKPPNFGKKASEETRKRISEVQIGKPKGPQSLAHRANHLKAMATRKKTPRWSEKRRASFAFENRTWTPERKAAFKALMTGRKRGIANAPS